MKKIIYLLIFISISCKTIEKTASKIDIKGFPSENYKVIAWYDEEKKDIWALSFPLVLLIENQSLRKEELTFYQYIYKNQSEGAFAFLYDETNNKNLMKLSSTRKKDISPRKKKKFILYTKHLINDQNLSNEILFAYKDIKFSNDSISLDSFNNFKKKLPKLTQSFLSNDSIFLKFTNFDKKNAPPKRIKIPVKL